MSITKPPAQADFASTKTKKIFFDKIMRFDSIQTIKGGQI